MAKGRNRLGRKQVRVCRAVPAGMLGSLGCPARGHGHGERLGLAQRGAGRKSSPRTRPCWAHVV